MTDARKPPSEKVPQPVVRTVGDTLKVPMEDVHRQLALRDGPHKGYCQDSAGFLFSHRCDRRSAHQCQGCPKVVCNDHVYRRTDGRILCATCAKIEFAAQYKKDDPKKGAEQEGYPYFFPDAYYKGFGEFPAGAWGHGLLQAGKRDPNDFTEADGKSLKKEDGFEQDPQAS